MSDLLHLRAAFAGWRRAAEAAGLRGERLAELEDHLHSGVGAALAAGRTPAEAFLLAQAQLGDLSVLGQEFQQEDVMHPMSKVSGLAVALAALVLAMSLEGGHSVIFLSLPPLLLVLGVSLGGLVASHGPRRVWRACTVAVGWARAMQDEVEDLRWICRRGHRLAYAGGVLQVVIGAINACSVLDHPGLIGPQVGYTLIGLVHAVLIAELGFATAERWVAGRERSGSGLVAG